MIAKIILALAVIGYAVVDVNAECDMMAVVMCDMTNLAKCSGLQAFSKCVKGADCYEGTYKVAMDNAFKVLPDCSGAVTFLPSITLMAIVTVLLRLNL